MKRFREGVCEVNEEARNRVEETETVILKGKVKGMKRESKEDWKGINGGDQDLEEDYIEEGKTRET